MLNSLRHGWQIRVRDRKRGKRLRPTLEPLENRWLPSTILWTNEGTSTNDSDNFNATYGTNAAAARLIVETAISRWATIIENFNYNHVGDSGYAPTANTYSLSISAKDLGDGGRGVTNITGVDKDGKPYAASISLDDDGGGPGWYFDATPATSGEFTSLVTRYTASFNGSSNDFERTITHEIGHALGISLDSRLALNNDLTAAGTDQNSSSNGGGSQLYLFSAGSTTATFTAYNGGHIYEGPADPTAPSDPLNPNELMNDGRTIGAPPTTRELPTPLDADILRDAYGYSIEPTNEIDSFLATLENGVVTIHNDPQSTNENITLDSFTFLGTTGIAVNVDGIVSAFNVSNPAIAGNLVNSITVAPGTGTNTINILRNLPGVPISVTSQGVDTVNIGHDGTVQDNQGDISIDNPPSFTTINVDDSADNVARTVTLDRFTPSGYSTFGSIVGLAPATISYEYADTGAVNVSTGTGGATVNVRATGTNTTLIGHGFNTVNVGSNGSVGSIVGHLALENPPSFNTINVDDSADGTAHTVTLDRFTPGDDTAFGTIVGLAPATISYRYFDTNSVLINTGHGGDNFNVQATGAPVTINSGGRDFIDVGNGNTQNILDALSITTILVNPDQLIVDDSHDFSQHTVTLTSQSITGLSPGPIFYSTYALNSLLLEDGLNSSTYNVLSTAAQFKIGPIVVVSPETTIRSQGADTINVGNAGSLLGIVSGLTVDDSLDQATLNLNDQNDPAGHSVTVTNSAIIGLAPAEIDYGLNALGSLNINGSQGGSTYNVLSTQAPYTISGIVLETTTTTITSHGRDQVNVGDNGSVQNIAGNLFVHNPPSFTDLFIDDSADISPRNSVLGTDSLIGLAPAIITWTPADLSSLTILGSSSGGTYTVQGAADATVLQVGPGSATVNVQATSAPLTIVDAGGNGVFNIGSANNTLDSIQGALTIEAQSGGNTYNFNDQGTTSSQIYTLTATTLSRTGAGPISFTPVSDLINLNTGNGANTVNVVSTAANSTYNIDPGNSTFNIGNADNSLDDILGTLAIAGGAGNNTLNLFDQGSTNSREFSLFANSLIRTPSASSQVNGPTISILFDTTVSHFNLFMGNAGSLVFVGGTAAGTTYDIFGGGDEDEFVTENSSMDGIQGPLHIHDTAVVGIDPVLIFSDFVNPSGHIYTMQTGSLQRENLAHEQDMAPITWDSAAEVVLFLSTAGGSQVNVLSIGTPFLTAVQAGTGDTVTVGSQAPNLGGTLAGIQGTLRVQSPPGTTPHVILDDSGDTTARHATFQNLPFNPITIYGVSGLGPLPIYLQMDSSASVQVLGGSGNDTFSLTNTPGTPTLALDGGGGTNTLDYSSYVGDALVDLPLGIATAAAGGIHGFQNVTGSQGNDLIVGDANANVLVGGTGRNVLIGGAGSDILDASQTSDDNILIGGTTNFDLNLPALLAIKAEWDRTDLTFNQRFSDLFNGSITDLNQVNGQQILLNKSTVHADTSPDTLTGGLGHNWFFLDSDDTSNYTAKGNKKTTVT
jgi:hypothetical protein